MNLAREIKVTRTLNLIGLVVILSLGLDVLVYFYPGWFNHNSEYQWLVLWHGRKGMVVWVFLVFGAIIIFSYWLGRKLLKKLSRRGFGLFSPLWIFLLGILSPVIFTQIDRYGGYELLIRVLVPDHTSYFTDALRFRSKQELVKTYLENWVSLNTHSRTHPPGVILIFFSLNRLAEHSDWIQKIYEGLFKAKVREQIEDHFQVSVSEQTGAFLGLALMLFSGGLSAVLGYFLIRRFYGAELGFVSGLILVSVPAFSHKAPVMDQVFSVFILGSALMALKTCGKTFSRSFLLWLGSGLVIGSGLWLSPGVWSSFLFIPLLMMAESKSQSPGLSWISIFKKVVQAELIIFLGIAIALWVGSILLGVSWVKIWEVNRLGWHFNNTISGRLNPWKWILFNPYEFFFFASWPVVIGFLFKIWSEFKKLQSFETLDYFFIFSLFFLMALNFSGQICYESPRLCWFCVPLFSGLAIDGLLKSMKNLHSFILIIIFLLIIFPNVILRLIY